MSVLALWPDLQALTDEDEIPKWFLLGWISVESGGNIMSEGSPRLQEYGYFQVSQEEDTFGSPHDRLRTDRGESLRAGVALIRRYASVVDSWGIPREGSAFWPLVKLQHQIGAGATRLMVESFQAAHDGNGPEDWGAFKDWALDHPYNTSRRSYVQWGLDGVDKLIAKGKVLAGVDVVLGPLVRTVADGLGEDTVDYLGYGVTAALIATLLWLLIRRPHGTV